MEGFYGQIWVQKWGRGGRFLWTDRGIEMGREGKVSTDRSESRNGAGREGFYGQIWV